MPARNSVRAAREAGLDDPCLKALNTVCLRGRTRGGFHLRVGSARMVRARNCRLAYNGDGLYVPGWSFDARPAGDLVTRRMLINAQQEEELRIAIVNDTALENFQIETAGRDLRRGNIYRGIVSNIQPSLNAAFINFGAEKDGFLSLNDIVPEAYQKEVSGGRPRILDVLERGKPILVQVSKDAEGTKGAGVTTNVSLAARYLVLTPFDDTRGVSRKVEDEELRKQLRDQVAKLQVPDGGGFIVRTNAIEQTKTTLTKDHGAVLRLWKKIQTEFTKGSGPRLLHSDQDIIIRVLRDYLDTSVEEILIDEDHAFDKAGEYIRTFMPRGKMRLIRYSDRLPLFAKYDIDKQVERIFERTLPLPSGGSIVIDRTEALVAIDVNSGRATRAANQEETATQTNVEAAREVARQLRLRDIGGLIVVDFIDMRGQKNRTNVEKTLRDAMKGDKARFTVGKISDNGLVEINRQRIQQALNLRTHRACPTCEGTGRIASPEMVGLNLLRRIEARAAQGSLGQVRIALHPELADAFQNGRRQQIAALEREFDIRVEVIASSSLHRPEQEIEWTNRGGADAVPPVAVEHAHKPNRPLGPNRKQKSVPQNHVAPAPPKSEVAAPSSVAAPESELEGQHPEGSGAKRKRRGRRRKGRNGVAAVGETTESASPHDQADDSEPVTHETEESEEALQDGVEISSDHEETAVEGEAADGSLPRKKRRRRGGRRRGGRGGAHSSEVEAAISESPLTPVLWEFGDQLLERGPSSEERPDLPSGSAAVAETNDDPAERESEAAEIVAPDESEIAETDEIAAGDSVKPTRKRKPRPRSRKKPAAVKASDDVQTELSEPDDSAASDVAAGEPQGSWDFGESVSSADDAEGSKTAAAPRKRRPRRRSPKPEAGTAAKTDGGDLEES